MPTKIKVTLGGVFVEKLFEQYAEKYATDNELPAFLVDKGPMNKPVAARTRQKDSEDCIDWDNLPL